MKRTAMTERVIPDAPLHWYSAHFWARQLVLKMESVGPLAHLYLVRHAPCFL